jgi:hypothetical protein
MTFAQGLASKTYNDTIKQYSDQAGVGIGPQSAASIYQTGMLGNLASQAAANAARGSTASTLGGATAGLIAALTRGGLSPAMAAQVAKMFGGSGGSANIGGGMTGGDTPGSTAPDTSGAPVTGGDSGWYIDQNGNTVQGIDPNLGYQVPDFGSGFGGFDMGLQ